MGYGCSYSTKEFLRGYLHYSQTQRPHPSELSPVFHGTYYSAVEIRQGCREQIDLDRHASDVEVIKAWLLLESAHSEFLASQEKTDHFIEVPAGSSLQTQLFD
jgi:hypothetical protein